MGTSNHKYVTSDAHRPWAWEYADAAARTAATGFVSQDIGRCSLQIDTGELYRLSGYSPIAWTKVGGAAGGITVEEADGSPSGTVSKIIFPSGTIGIVSGVATYTPAGGGGGGGGSAMGFPVPTLPSSGSLSAYYNGAYTLGSTILQITSTGGDQDWSGVKIPTSGNFDKKFGIRYAISDRNYGGVAVGVFDSVTGAKVMFGIRHDAGSPPARQWRVLRFGNNFNAGISAGLAPASSADVNSWFSPTTGYAYLRIKYDGTNITFYLSPDGNQWLQVATYTTTTVPQLSSSSWSSCVPTHVTINVSNNGTDSLNYVGLFDYSNT